jgi:hypothetical protein
MELRGLARFPKRRQKLGKFAAMAGAKPGEFDKPGTEGGGAPQKGKIIHIVMSAGRIWIHEPRLGRRGGFEEGGGQRQAAYVRGNFFRTKTRTLGDGTDTAGYEIRIMEPAGRTKRRLLFADKTGARPHPEFFSAQRISFRVHHIDIDEFPPGILSLEFHRDAFQRRSIGRRGQVTFGTIGAGAEVLV